MVTFWSPVTYSFAIIQAAGGGRDCELRLEDRGSNELFAACPVEGYPGLAVEAVTDSSRYFVICILDKESGRKVSTYLNE